MILNGKAKEDFLKYYWETQIKPLKFTVCQQKDLGDFFESIVPQLQQALIIEWLDSVKIYISINYVNFVNELTSVKGFEAMITNKHLTTRFREVKTRQEATEKAIEKANEIYNNQK